MKPAECPWCHAAVNDLRAPCPHCGKLASDLRTTDPPDAKVGMTQIAMQAAQAVPDIPDLVVPVAKPSMKPATKAMPPPAGAVDFDDELAVGGDLQIDLSAAEAPPKPGIARPPTPGAGFSPFDDDMSSGGPAIELDTVGGSLPPRISSPNVNASQPAPPVPPAPISHRSLQPPVQALEPAKPPVDPYEARVLADYGPKPDGFWNAPMYAYRVMTRRSALQRDLATKKTEAERALKRYEDALVALGERARGTAPTNAIERVKQAEDLLRSRDGALAQSMDAHKGVLAEIDARLGAAEAELARARQDEAKAQAVREGAEQDFQRADAKVKRLEIEIRNGAANKSAERDALALDAQQKGAVRVDADKKLAEHKRVAAVAQAKADSVSNERAQQEAKFSRASGTRNAGVDDAQRHLRAALVELGRTVLSDPSAAAELAHAKEEITRLDTQAQKSTSDVALHESAIGSFDAPQVFLGMILVGVALLLVVVLILFPFIYRAVAT
jgi:hypothetical protein